MSSSLSSSQYGRPAVLDASVKATAERIATLLAREPALAACLPDRQAFLALQDHCKHTISLVEGICSLYKDRPAVAWRPSQPLATDGPAAYTSMTYEQVWKRVGRLATGLARHNLAGPGRFVGVWGHASPSWLVADLACLYSAATGAPLQTSLPLGDLVGLVDADALSVIICSTLQLPQMAKLVEKTQTVRTVVVMDEEMWPLTPALRAAWQAVEATCAVTTVERLEAEVGDAAWTAMRRPGEDGVSADTLVSLLYTSGSTGLPKGAMFDDRLWRENFRQSFFGDVGEMPWVNYAYLPLNHLAGLGLMFSVMAGGGISYFTSQPDMSHLFEDLRDVRPTMMMLVPRVSSLIYQRFGSAMAKQMAAGRSDDDETHHAVVAGMRETVLGDRLVMLLLGTAPTSNEVTTFLRECFAVPVFDAFGQTENGGLLFAGQILRAYITDYKLVDVPELGYFTTDKPYPRGELLIKSRRMIKGYYNNPEATAALFDADGYMKTGDIMEEQAPDALVWVDRKRNILKLSQGEFVSLSRLEGIYTDGCPLVAQAYMYGKSSASYLLAVVCPDVDRVAELLRRKGEDPQDKAAVKSAILADIAHAAHSHGLASFEVPRDLIVFDGAFTRENGLLTESNKPARPHLKAQFGPQLDAMFEAASSRQFKGVADFRAQDFSGWSTRDKVLRAVGIVLEIDQVDKRDDASFTQLGGDSIAAVTLGELLEEVCGMTLSAGSILDPSASLNSLVARLDGQASGRSLLTFRELHPDPSGPRRADLNLERVLPATLLRPEKRAKTRLRRQINHVFLTGATGFLGRFLLLELLSQAQKSGGHVTCLVRATTDQAARERLQASMAANAPQKRDSSEVEKRFATLGTTDRLTVLAGDFAQPDFGLPADVYTRLTKNVDCVVHNGALVNHAYNYEQEFAPNVGGTVEVMRFALHGRRKILSYVSSVAVTQGVQRDDTLLEKESPGDWWPDFPPADQYAAGYGTSKWVCEVLLRQLHDVCGIPVNIFRPSMILGHSQAVGQINVVDVFTRLIVSLIATEIAPPSFYVADYQGSKRYDGMPVDFVATAIAALAVQSHGPVQSYNVVNPHKDDPSLDTMVQQIERAGYNLQRIDDYDTWYAMFQERLEGLPAALKQHSLLPLVEMWKHPTVQAPARLGTAQFRRDVALLTDYEEPPHLDEAFVGQTLGHLQYWGLIAAPNAHEAAPSAPMRAVAQDGAATT